MCERSDDILFKCLIVIGSQHVLREESYQFWNVKVFGGLIWIFFSSSKIAAYFATFLTVLRRVKDGQLEEAKRAVVLQGNSTVTRGINGYGGYYGVDM